MMSVFDHTEMAKVAETGPSIERISVRIYRRRLRSLSLRDHPFAARNLGFQKSIAESRHNRDRIEDEDEQHHRGDRGGIHSVIWVGYHDLEANPVQQRRYPIELCVPWSPKPIGSARRWRACRICLFDVIKILHLQSLSIWKNSTGSSDWKPIRPHHRGPITHGRRKTPAPSFPPALHRALFYGSNNWAYFKSWTWPQ